MWAAWIAHAGPIPIDWRRGMEAALAAADVEGMVREAMKQARIADNMRNAHMYGLTPMDDDAIVARVMGEEGGASKR